MQTRNVGTADFLDVEDQRADAMLKAMIAIDHRDGGLDGVFAAFNATKAERQALRVIRGLWRRELDTEQADGLLGSIEELRSPNEQAVVMLAECVAEVACRPGW